ncbi:capsule assembly Wzi family protein [Treponema sp.]|uniref:capsule assembly Wzi family protein n=1 Tax=Treponema sp. TaxID=166 RepID=UPI00298DFE2D|nr:capsule assembly Wzi family protein [Treponema sp.]MCR5614291.1 capsule assembly Wzi family protein [Treponema sp.]
MKRLIFILMLLPAFLYAQEALKSIEQEYYDFLSLTGVTERPTLGYRTLSDNVWKFNEVETFEENEDGTFTKVRIPGEESDAHIWKNNNLGTTYTLWEAPAPADNWFARGIKQGFTVRIYGPEWFNSYNTAAPYGQNDGALWQGRGYNTSLTAGVRLEGYGFELTFKPQVCWMENREFKTLGNVYGNNYGVFFGQPVDLVQRYGNSPFWNYDWGDSEIRWSWHTFTLGFGTQNPWLGPAYLNPMLGSNNAPGYPKLDVGFRKTEIIIPYLGWNLGHIEGRLWVGRFEESKYFDKNPNNNSRMLTALSASYSPSFIPGFTIGINRIFMTYWRMENLKYLFRLFTDRRENALASSGNDEDQKVSVFAEWAFPKVGFTIYGEFGRDDFSSDEDSNPFHTAIYTIGAKQNIPLPFGLKSELNLEWNNFEMSQDFQLQWPYLGYYAHGFVYQGYTHKGQILGAGSGVFGNSQFIQYKVYYPKGYTALKFHRYCPNNNSVYSKAVKTKADATEGPIYTKWYANFETYFVYGIESDYYITPQFSVNAAFNYIYIIHSNYDYSENLNNFNLQLLLKYCL